MRPRTYRSSAPSKQRVRNRSGDLCWPRNLRHHAVAGVEGVEPGLRTAQARRSSLATSSRPTWSRRRRCATSRRARRLLPEVDTPLRACRACKSSRRGGADLIQALDYGTRTTSPSRDAVQAFCMDNRVKCLFTQLTCNRAWQASATRTRPLAWKTGPVIGIPPPSPSPPRATFAPVLPDPSLNLRTVSERSPYGLFHVDAASCYFRCHWCSKPKSPRLNRPAQTSSTSRHCRRTWRSEGWAPCVKVTVETPSEDGSPWGLSVDSITKVTERQVFLVAKVIEFVSQQPMPRP